MRLRWILRAGLVICAFSSFLQADVAKIDLHSKNEPDRYFLIFLSRPIRPNPVNPSPGHAFVAWVREDHANNLTLQEPYGYYPRRGVGVFGAVPGNIVDEYLKGSLLEATRSLVVQVDASTYAGTRKILDN